MNTASKKNNKIILGIGIILLVCISIYGFFKYDEIYPSTDDAYINAKLVNVAAKVGAYMSHIYITNNQYVHKGDLLFTLDPHDYALNFEQAEKNYLSQISMTQIAHEQLKVQQGQIKKDQQQLKFLFARAIRYSNLKKINIISQQDYQNAITEYKNAKMQLKIDYDKLNQYTNGFKYARSKEQASKSQMLLANTNLKNTKYFAPISGYITNLNTLNVGEYINPSQQLFGIVDNSEWWIDANFKETQLKRLKIGQKVTIKLDMYNHIFVGTLQSISYASGNTFSLLPAQNATGNWVKITQRFPVKIKIENSKEFPLRVGGSAKVTINTLNNK